MYILMVQCLFVKAGITLALIKLSILSPCLLIPLYLQERVSPAWRDPGPSRALRPPWVAPGHGLWRGREWQWGYLEVLKFTKHFY